MRAALPRLALGLVLVALGAAPSARAQVANGAAFGDWTVTCTAESTARTLCALSQTVVARQDGAFLAEVGLNPAGDGAVMVLRTPAAMLLPVQPAYRIGPSAPVALAWRTCAGDVCTAVAALDAAQVGALRRGRSMTLGYQRISDGRPTTFDVSLSGVTAGLEALRAASSAASGTN